MRLHELVTVKTEQKHGFTDEILRDVLGDDYEIFMSLPEDKKNTMLNMTWIGYKNRKKRAELLEIGKKMGIK